MSEQSDAVVVVVPEETGTISLVIGGKIIRDMKEDNLRKELKRRLERKEKQIKTHQFMSYIKKNTENILKK